MALLPPLLLLLPERRLQRVLCESCSEQVMFFRKKKEILHTGKGIDST